MRRLNYLQSKLPEGWSKVNWCYIAISILLLVCIVQHCSLKKANARLEIKAHVLECIKGCTALDHDI